MKRKVFEDVFTITPLRLLRHHGLGNGLRHVERPVHVGGDHTIPSIFRTGEHTVLLPVLDADARVVHEDVDAAEAFDGLVDHAVHGIVIGDIARYGMNAILVAERIL